MYSLPSLADHFTPPAHAGFGYRLGALLIDGLILLVPYVLLWLGGSVALVATMHYSGALTLLLALTLILVSVSLPFVYYVFLGNGTTFGKRALGLKVVDSRTYGEIRRGQAVGRYFAYMLSSMVFYLGFLWMLWDERQQTWHDNLANTVVVRVT